MQQNKKLLRGLAGTLTVAMIMTGNGFSGLTVLAAPNQAQSGYVLEEMVGTRIPTYENGKIMVFFKDENGWYCDEHRVDSGDTVEPAQWIVNNIVAQKNGWGQEVKDNLVGWRCTIDGKVYPADKLPVITKPCSFYPVFESTVIEETTEVATEEASTEETTEVATEEASTEETTEVATEEASTEVTTEVATEETSTEETNTEVTLDDSLIFEFDSVDAFYTYNTKGPFKLHLGLINNPGIHSVKGKIVDLSNNKEGLDNSTYKMELTVESGNITFDSKTGEFEYITDGNFNGDVEFATISVYNTKDIPSYHYSGSMSMSLGIEDLEVETLTQKGVKKISNDSIEVEEGSLYYHFSELSRYEPADLYAVESFVYCFNKPCEKHHPDFYEELAKQEVKFEQTPITFLLNEDKSSQKVDGEKVRKTIYITLDKHRAVHTVDGKIVVKGTGCELVGMELDVDKDLLSNYGRYYSETKVSLDTTTGEFSFYTPKNYCAKVYGNLWYSVPDTFLKLEVLLDKEAEVEISVEDVEATMLTACGVRKISNASFATETINLTAQQEVEEADEQPSTEEATEEETFEEEIYEEAPDEETTEVETEEPTSESALEVSLATPVIFEFDNYSYQERGIHNPEFELHLGLIDNPGIHSVKGKITGLPESCSITDMVLDVDTGRLVFDKETGEFEYYAEGNLKDASEFATIKVQASIEVDSWSYMASKYNVDSQITIEDLQVTTLTASGEKKLSKESTEVETGRIWIYNMYNSGVRRPEDSKLERNHEWNRPCRKHHADFYKALENEELEFDYPVCFEFRKYSSEELDGGKKRVTVNLNIEDIQPIHSVTGKVVVNGTGWELEDVVLDLHSSYQYGNIDYDLDSCFAMFNDKTGTFEFEIEDNYYGDFNISQFAKIILIVDEDASDIEFSLEDLELTTQTVECVKKISPKSVTTKGLVIKAE